ncbi:hypothetical protein LCGC14_1767510 [marine sediment metagenome]|uniref:Uncharacterized protein n=1 Tax=marine sediment metagenome TaxID=412755 RepID=A0A0F9GZ54_9ZZZZ
MIVAYVIALAAAAFFYGTLYSRGWRDYYLCRWQR